jgi:hypothetical protein
MLNRASRRPSGSRTCSNAAGLKFKSKARAG